MEEIEFLQDFNKLIENKDKKEKFKKKVSIAFITPFNENKV